MSLAPLVYRKEARLKTSQLAFRAGQDMQFRAVAAGRNSLTVKLTPVSLALSSLDPALLDHFDCSTQEVSPHEQSNTQDAESQVKKSSLAATRHLAAARRAVAIKRLCVQAVGQARAPLLLQLLLLLLLFNTQTTNGYWPKRHHDSTSDFVTDKQASRESHCRHMCA